MRKQGFAFAIIVAIVIAAPSVMAQKSAKKKDKKNEGTCCASVLKLETHQDTISYLIGRDIGRNMKTNEITVSADIMYAGLKDGLNGIDSLFTPEQTEQCMMEFQQEIMAKQQQKSAQEASATKAEGEAFLAKNKTEDGVVTTPSGLQYKVIKEGEGDHPTAQDVVEVHYTGKLIDGTVFDSSVERGEPIKFPLNGVIPGWTEGVQLMKPGAKYIFYIPSSLAYGDRGTGPIPGGSTLIFEVELLSIEKK